MNEQDFVSDERAVAAQSAVEAPGPEDSAPPSYGARLAWQRQGAGLSVTDVAASLRLHPNQIRAIEQEDLARLPAPAYVRGFIRSYARMLNIDPAPLLSDLNAKLAPARESVVDRMATDYVAARAAGRERMLPQWAHRHRIGGLDCAWTNRLASHTAVGARAGAAGGFGGVGRATHTRTSARDRRNRIARERSIRLLPSIQYRRRPK